MRRSFFQGRRQAVMASLLILAGTIVISRTMKGQFPPSSNQTFIPNGTSFLNLGGASQTYSTVGGGIDQTGPFFQSLGTNGRSCASCHQPSDAMSVSALHVQLRFDQTAGLDPIFRTVDGSNCDHNIDVSTLPGRSSAYSLLRTRGLIRIALAVPSGADYAVTAVSNPYACNETNVISQYRRPLPATNLTILKRCYVGRPGVHSAYGHNQNPLCELSRFARKATWPTSRWTLPLRTRRATARGRHPPNSRKSSISRRRYSPRNPSAFFTGPLNSAGANGGPMPLAYAPVLH